MRPEELTITNEANANKRAAFDEAVQELFGELGAAAPNKPSRESLDHSKNFELDNKYCQAFENIVLEAEAVNATGKPINQQSFSDLLINDEVFLPQEDAYQMAKIICQALGADGKIMQIPSSTLWCMMLSSRMVWSNNTLLM